MRAKFSLFSEPLSINSTYYGDKRHGMTAAAKQWLHGIFFQLARPDVAVQLKQLRETFDPDKHGYAIRLIFHFPESVLYTKTGVLSSKAMDLTNIEKSLVDALFLPKNFGTDVPYNCQNLNIDDRYLKRLYSEKRATAEHRIDITIKLVPK